MRQPHRAGQVDHLHQPQAERGARDRRPDHRAAPRQDDRDAPARGRDGGGPGAADGRPRRAAARRQAPAQPGRAAARVEDLHVVDDRGIEKVRGVSFDVRAGEIVGIAGVDGNGQTELIDALTGLRGSPAARSWSAARTSSHDERARPLRRRPRPHPGGPAAPRARARVLDRREHRAARLPRAARLEARLALPGPTRRAGAGG